MTSSRADFDKELKKSKKCLIYDNNNIFIASLKLVAISSKKETEPAKVGQSRFSHRYISRTT